MFTIFRKISAFSLQYPTRSAASSEPGLPGCMVSDVVDSGLQRLQRPNQYEGGVVIDGQRECNPLQRTIRLFRWRLSEEATS